LPKADTVRLVASAKSDGHYAMRSAVGQTSRRGPAVRTRSVRTGEALAGMDPYSARHSYSETLARRIVADVARATAAGPRSSTAASGNEIVLFPEQLIVG
jgi:hypothetical protein